eukprot:5856849-Pyramimonas_sp.AAC.1
MEGMMRTIGLEKGGMQVVPAEPGKKKVLLLSAVSSAPCRNVLLVPSPRGSLSNLKPVPWSSLPVANQQSVQQVYGVAHVSVRAVGLNFRDALDVLGMYPGDPGPPG